MTTLEGIDVYEGQGYVNWRQVKQSNKVFGIAKATEGTYHEDETLPHNWVSIRYRGMIRIAYHYMRADIDGSLQCDFMHQYVRRCGGFKYMDGVMLDVEETDNRSPVQVINEVARFVVQARRTINKQVLIYTNYNTWVNELGNPKDSILASCPLVLASYGPIHANFDNWPEGPAFWQYSDTGHCPGVDGPVDLDRFFGDYKQLQTIMRYP